MVNAATLSRAILTLCSKIVGNVFEKIIFCLPVYGFLQDLVIIIVLFCRLFCKHPHGSFYNINPGKYFQWTFLNVSIFSFFCY